VLKCLLEFWVLRCLLRSSLCCLWFHFLVGLTVCRFCKTSVEKPAHIFFTCPQIQPIWTQIKMVISKLDGVNTLDLTYYVVTQFVIPPQLKHLEEHLTYLFSTTRYKIWTHRNEIESRTTVFSAQRIIKSIKRSIHHRLAMEKQTALQKFTRTFEELKRAFTWTLIQDPLPRNLSLKLIAYFPLNRKGIMLSKISPLERLQRYLSPCVMTVRDTYINVWQNSATRSPATFLNIDVRTFI